MELTKSQEYTVKHLVSLKILSITMALFGLLGLFLGLYATFFRPMSPDARPLNFVLTCFSVGIFVSGCLLKHTCGIMDKLYKNQ